MLSDQVSGSGCRFTVRVLRGGGGQPRVRPRWPPRRSRPRGPSAPPAQGTPPTPADAERWSGLWCAMRAGHVWSCKRASAGGGATDPASVQGVVCMVGESETSWSVCVEACVGRSAILLTADSIIVLWVFSTSLVGGGAWLATSTARTATACSRSACSGPIAHCHGGRGGWRRGGGG